MGREMHGEGVADYGTKAVSAGDEGVIEGIKGGKGKVEGGNEDCSEEVRGGTGEGGRGKGGDREGKEG